MCDFPDKFHIGIVEQDVKVLDGMDGLEGLPILKPNDLHSTVNWANALPANRPRFGNKALTLSGGN